MSAYKEIVTKAVVGKGKKYYRNTYTINTEFAPNTVLGCWVINHKFEGHEVHGKIEIDGSFDVNLWYSYDNDTKTSVTINQNGISIKKDSITNTNKKFKELKINKDGIIIKTN